MTIRFFLVCMLLPAVVVAQQRKENQKTFSQKRPNILFIPVDDLRPELGAYGNKIIITPNIDKLAAQGILFNRAYCQLAVCNPSRASLLTGLRPDTLQVWDLQTRFRDILPDVITLPQFFKNQGYSTFGIGKAFHNDIPDTVSWTRDIHLDGFPFDPDAVYINESNKKIQEHRIENFIKEGTRKKDQLGYWYVKAEATETGDGDDDMYYDGAQTTAAISLLQQLKSEEKPFFLSVGYYRPHLPFNAPKKYWDMYNPAKLPLPGNTFVPKGSPLYAVHGDVEMRSYIDQRDLPWPEEKPLDIEKQRHLIHGYYASVSYMDAQVGRLINELNRLGLAENTIIVLWGDHGWKLGEHNSWGKMSNFEIDTHVPLLFSGAGIKAKGKKTDSFAEFVDIYPTLIEMAGFNAPTYLHGKSLVPLFSNPLKQIKHEAYSQFLLGRFGPSRTRQTERMGYTVRTDLYRYTEWYLWDKQENKVTELLDKELFDHKKDPNENINMAGDPGKEKVMQKLHEKLALKFAQIQ